jgi:hypothetical protein
LARAAVDWVMVQLEVRLEVLGSAWVLPVVLDWEEGRLVEWPAERGLVQLEARG